MCHGTTTSTGAKRCAGAPTRDVLPMRPARGKDRPARGVALGYGAAVSPTMPPSCIVTVRLLYDAACAS
jgi:hypothetical protein